jgi:hypothetical protein
VLPKFENPNFLKIQTLGLKCETHGLLQRSPNSGNREMCIISLDITTLFALWRDVKVVLFLAQGASLTLRRITINEDILLARKFLGE